MAAWLNLKIEFACYAAIGPYRSAVMEAIERYGSISAAGRAVGITFRQTWTVVQAINDECGEIIITKRGRGSGGAHLTPKGAELLHRYRDLERKIYETFATEIKALEAVVGEKPKSGQLIPRWAQILEDHVADKSSQRKQKKAAGPQKRTRAK